MGRPWSVPPQSRRRHRLRCPCLLVLQCPHLPPVGSLSSFSLCVTSKPSNSEPCQVPAHLPSFLCRPPQSHMESRGKLLHRTEPWRNLKAGYGFPPFFHVLFPPQEKHLSRLVQCMYFPVYGHLGIKNHSNQWGLAVVIQSLNC